MRNDHVPALTHDADCHADNSNYYTSETVMTQDAIQKCLEALEEIYDFTLDAPDDDPLSHVHGVARNALISLREHQSKQPEGAAEDWLEEMVVKKDAAFLNAGGEFRKIEDDLRNFGVAFERDGKRINPKDVYLSLHERAIEAMGYSNMVFEEYSAILKGKGLSATASLNDMCLNKTKEAMQSLETYHTDLLDKLRGMKVETEPGGRFQNGYNYGKNAAIDDFIKMLEGENV